MYMVHMKPNRDDKKNRTIISLCIAPLRYEETDGFQLESFSLEKAFSIDLER